MNWQPIETAPKNDGKIILVYEQGQGFGIVLWDDEYGWIDYHDGLRTKLQPTHWAELQPP